MALIRPTNYYSPLSPSLRALCQNGGAAVLSLIEVVRAPQGGGGGGGGTRPPDIRPPSNSPPSFVRSSNSTIINDYFIIIIFLLRKSNARIAQLNVALLISYYSFTISLSCREKKYLNKISIELFRKDLFIFEEIRVNGK